MEPPSGPPENPSDSVHRQVFASLPARPGQIQLQPFRDASGDTTIDRAFSFKRPAFTLEPPARPEDAKRYTMESTPLSDEELAEGLEVFQPSCLEGRTSESIDLRGFVDTMTTADSGYQSGPRTSCTNVGEDGVLDDDADSVVTDGWPSSFPRQDKYMLEAEFAREIFNRSSARTREQFVKRGQTVKDLLYSFSVMMWGRATTVAERGAASFVRHGRKYVPSGPDLNLRDYPYAHTLIL